MKEEPQVSRRSLLDAGLEKLDSGRFFQAHDEFETLWRRAPNQSERDLWQALSQLAAALVKHERGEPATAITLLAKARTRLLASRLLPDPSEGLRDYLDAISAAVTTEKDLPSSGLPGEVVEALGRLIQRTEPDEEGGAIS
jgi:predicted metal-dependent hydrolase